MRPCAMKTVQMTLTEELIKKLDQVVKDLHTTRSAFTRQALWEAITHIRTRKLEKKHRQGYEKKPVQPGEFDAWEKEQVWGD